MLLLRMLSLGQGAWDMIDSQVFKEPRLVRTEVTFLYISHCISSYTHKILKLLDHHQESICMYWLELRLSSDHLSFLFFICVAVHTHSGFGGNDPLPACNDVSGCG